MYTIYWCDKHTSTPLFDVPTEGDAIEAVNELESLYTMLDQKTKDEEMTGEYGYSKKG